MGARNSLVLPILVTVSWSSAWASAVVSTNNHVSSSISGADKATWDPGDAVTVSGQLRAFAGQQCIDGGPINPQYDGFDLKFVSAEPPLSASLGLGHNFCTSVASTPGTDINGNFIFSVRGGGVSWSAGDGTQVRGSVVKINFQEDKDIDNVTLLCGNSATYPILSAYGGCPSAPEIYGKLASPDLTGDLFIDSSDFPVFASFLTGQPASLVSGWQADFNHDGWADAGDVAYFAGRVGKNCMSQKSDTGDFAMDVRNLSNPAVVAFLGRYGITRSGAIAFWEAMGLSYDRSAASRIQAEQARSWSTVKAQYRVR